MPLFHIVILALIQGLTEFLPVSSSGHLVLAHEFLRHSENSDLWGNELTLDVAVHIGTLLAVLLYFYKDILTMLCGMTKIKSQGQMLAVYVVLASVPVIIAGFILHCLEPSWLRSVEVAAWSTIIFALVLWWGDKKSPQDRTIEHITLKDSLLIGVSQILALIPGTSRSGITMTAARFLGFSRTECARFSLLLAIVAISGAGTLTGLDLWQSGDLSLGTDALLAIILSFFAGWASIAVMMRWLEKSSFMPFVYYRIGLGILLLGLIYSGIL